MWGCGAVLQHTVSTHADGRTFHRYACTAAAHLSRTQPELDAYVEAVVLAYLRANTGAHNAQGRQAQRRRHRRAAHPPRRPGRPKRRTRNTFHRGCARRARGAPRISETPAAIAAIDAALADAARRNPVAELVADGPTMVEKRWAALSADLKGKIIDELVTVTVGPSPRGRNFQPEYVNRLEDRPVRARHRITAVVVRCESKGHELLTVHPNGGRRFLEYDGHPGGPGGMRKTPTRGEWVVVLSPSSRRCPRSSGKSTGRKPERSQGCSVSPAGCSAAVALPN